MVAEESYCTSTPLVAQATEAGPVSWWSEDSKVGVPGRRKGRRTGEVAMAAADIAWFIEGCGAGCFT